MSVWMKIAHMKYKDSRGLYDVVNTISDQATSEQLSDIQNVGSSAISDVQQAAADSQETVASIDAQYSHMAAVIASVAEMGTDNTLSQPGVAADAAATGVLKSAADSLSNIIDAVEIHETVSTPADILTITDGADDIPVDNLTVAVEPVQDLHGYEYPWPAGGGKNKFDSTSASGSNMTISNGVFVNSNTDTRDYVNLRIQARNGTSVIGELASLSIRSTGNKSLTFTFDSSTSDNIFVKHSGSTRDIGFTYPLAEDGTFTLSMNFTGVDPTTVGGMAFKDVQIESGAAATSYAPYSNVCPISGWTGANVKRTRKNLFQKFPFESKTVAGVNVSVAEDGSITLNGTASGSQLELFYAYLQSGTYKLKDFAIGTFPSNGSARTQVSSNEFADVFTTVPNSGNSEYVNTLVVEKPGMFSFRIRVHKDFTYSNCVLKPMLTYGDDVPTSYEPYQGDTYPIAFPSQAGTVYGGTLTINQDGSGSLVVDRAQTILSSSNSWNKIASNIYTIFRTKPAGIKTSSTATADGLSCDKFKCEFGVVQDNRCYIDSEGLTFRTASSYNNATEFLQDVGDIQVVYPLAETQTYTLTASQITTLLGTNNFWSNAGPINKLAYCADSKMYIDNKISQAVAAALNA